MNDSSRGSRISSHNRTRSTPDSQKPAKAGRRPYFVLLALTLVLLELPVLTVQRVPLLDLPNHTARDYILYHYASVPQFTERLWIDISPLPNLAMEIVVVPLQRIVDVFAATKIFVALVVLVFCIACLRLERVIKGRNTYAALFCAGLVYSATFLFGFLNYLLGVAVYFLVLALYCRWKDRLTVLRVIGLAILVMASFLCHLTSFGFVAVSIVFIAVWDFAEKQSWRGLLFSGAALVPAMLLTAQHQLRYRPDDGFVFAYAGLKEKVAVAASLIRTFSVKLDIVLVFLLAIVLATILVRGRCWRVHRRFLALGGVFVAFALVMPFEFGTSQYFDLRFVLPGCVLGILSVDVQLKRREEFIIVVLLSTFVLLRTGNIWREWRNMDREAASIIQSFSRLQEGCRIAVRQFLPQDASSRKTRLLYSHVIQYSTVTRHCTPDNLLAIPGQQPVLWRERKRRYVDTPPHRKPLPTPENSDYVVTYSAPRELREYMERSSTKIYSKDAFMVWSFRPEDRP